jgi:hypothetical protein
VLWLLKEHEVVGNPKVFKVLGFPLALAVFVAVMGLAKLVLGRSLGEMARDWDNLAGWQRGVVGLIVVALAIVVIMTAVGIMIVVMM